MFCNIDCTDVTTIWEPNNSHDVALNHNLLQVILSVFNLDGRVNIIKDVTVC